MHTCKVKLSHPLDTTYQLLLQYELTQQPGEKKLLISKEKALGFNVTNICV